MEPSNIENIRKVIRKQLNEDDFDIPQEYQEFDDYEFHGDAKNAAMKDIGDDFEEIGDNKFEKGMTQKDFANNVTKANLGLNDYEKEVKKIQKGLDFKKQGDDKLQGLADKMGTHALSMNEAYDFDVTNLYKFLKDALYTFEDKKIAYAKAAEILEKELNKNFKIEKK